MRDKLLFLIYFYQTSEKILVIGHVVLLHGAFEHGKGLWNAPFPDRQGARNSENCAEAHCSGLVTRTIEF